MSKTPEEIAASIIAEWRKAYPHHEAVLERAIVMELRAERDVIARLTRGRDEALEALRPFAHLADQYGAWADESHIACVYVGHLRRARAVLSRLQGAAARTTLTPSADTLARHRALGDAIDQIGAPRAAEIIKDDANG